MTSIKSKRSTRLTWRLRQILSAQCATGALRMRWAPSPTRCVLLSCHNSERGLGGNGPIRHVFASLRVIGHLSLFLVLPVQVAHEHGEKYPVFSPQDLHAVSCLTLFLLDAAMPVTHCSHLARCCWQRQSRPAICVENQLFPTYNLILSTRTFLIWRTCRHNLQQCRRFSMRN